MDKPSDVLQGYALRDFTKAIEILRSAFERLWAEHEKAKTKLADREKRLAECKTARLAMFENLRETQRDLDDAKERLALWRGIQKTINIYHLRLNPYIYEGLKQKGEI